MPQNMLDLMTQVGWNIQTARLRRCWTQEDTAKRAHVGLSALKKIESGDLSVEFSSLAAILWTLGLEETLTHLADPTKDHEGLQLENARQRTTRRVRTSHAGYDNDF